MTRIKIFVYRSYDKWFCINHDKRLQVYFCVMRQANNDFQKDVESTVNILDQNAWPLAVFSFVCVFDALKDNSF